MIGWRIAPLLGLLAWATASTFATADLVAHRVTDLGGTSHALADGAAPATVWVFLSHDCPVCNAYAPELNRIAKQYAGRGVVINVVYCEVGLTAGDLKAHAKDHGFSGALFYDGKETLAGLLGIDVTPEVAVIDRAGTLAYRGRIDDRYTSPGTERPQPTSLDLRWALDSILRGASPAVARTAAVGCSLETP
jgi:thiol-disulfide isomerase/thioredoxin